MPVESNLIHQDIRIIKTAAKIPNGEIDHKIQLLTSYYLRHTEAYQAFNEAIRGKSQPNCLMIGLGNLSEMIGYTAAYYGQHHNINGLQIKAVDLIESSFFYDISRNKETYYLKKDEQNSPIKPLSGQETAFYYDPEKSEFILRSELVKKIQETIEKGSFGVGVENISRLGLNQNYFDFISCQNVLTYVTKTILPDDMNIMTNIVKNLINLMSKNGILAIKTNGRNKAIAAIMEKENLPVKFFKNQQKDIHGLYQKTDQKGQIKGYLEILASHQAQIARFKSEKER